MNEENAIKYSIILEFINRTQELEAAVQRIQQQLQELQSRSRQATEDSEGAIEAVVSSLAFLYAGRAILTRYLMPSIEIASSIEQWRVSLGVFYGDLVKTNKTMQFMMDYARRTPFTLPQVIAAGRQLAAYRLQVEEWLPVLGDLAAAVGRDIVEISYIFGYMAGERWGEFFEAIARIGVARKEFERFGVKIEASTGRVKSSAKEIRTALKQIVQEHFARIQELLAKTAVGLRSMVEDAKTRLREMFMLGITSFETLEETSTSMFATYKRYLQVTKIFYELEPIQAFFAGLSKGLGGIFSLLTGIARIILAIFEGISKIRAVSFISEATGRVLGMAVAIGILVQTFKALRAVWTILFSTKNLEVFSSILSFLTNKNIQLKGIFSETLSVVKKLLTLDFSGLKQGLEGAFSVAKGGSEQAAFSLGMLFTQLKSGLATVGRFALSFAILLALSYLLEWLFKKLWDTIARAEERSKKFYEELSENIKALREQIKSFLDYFDKMLDTELRIGEFRVRILSNIYDQERALTFYREKSAEARYKWELERIKIMKEAGIINENEALLMTALAQKQYMLSLYEEKALRVLESRRMQRELTLGIQTAELENQIKLYELEKARLEALGESYEPMIKQLDIRIAELEFERQKIALIDEYVEKLSSVAAMDEEVRNLLLQHFRLRLQALWIDKEITKEREKQKKQMSDTYVWVLRQNKLQLASLTELQKAITPALTNIQTISFEKEEKELLSRVTSSTVLAARANKEASDAVYRSTKLFEIRGLEIVRVLVDLKQLLNQYIALLKEQMALAQGRTVEPIKYVDMKELSENMKKVSTAIPGMKIFSTIDSLKKAYEKALKDWSMNIEGAEERLRTISIQLKTHSDLLAIISQNSSIYKDYANRMQKEKFPAVLDYLYQTVKTSTDIKRALPAAKIFPMYYQAFRDFTDTIGIYFQPEERAKIFQQIWGARYQRIFSLQGKEQEEAIKQLGAEIEVFRMNVERMLYELQNLPIQYRKPIQDLLFARLRTAKSPEEINYLMPLLTTLPDLLTGKFAPVSQKILTAISKAETSKIPSLVWGLYNLANLPRNEIDRIINYLQSAPAGKELDYLMRVITEKKAPPPKTSAIEKEGIDLGKLAAVSSPKEVNINLNNYFNISGAIEEETVENISISIERAVRNALLSAKYEV